MNWPPGTAELNRRLSCARYDVGTLSRFEQRKAISETLWPSDNVYGLHDWSLRRLRGSCEYYFNIWWGPAASGKTTDAAALAVAYWLEAPWETRVMVCSTTKLMLRSRIWSQIVRLWSALPPWLGYKGVLTDSEYNIRWKDGDAINCIAGFGVNEGPVEAAINDIIGVHTHRLFLILDEMQGVREAIMGALPNLVKNPEAHFLGMGNTVSMMSMLCKYAEPIGGWNTVKEAETESWEIDAQEFPGVGLAQFFDGRKSPAVLDPEWGRKHPWMISKEQVDRHIAKRGMNDPKVWAFTIGWPPKMGMDNTVLSPELIEKFSCRERAYWTEGYKSKAALDPAFAEGGDRKILQFLKVGMVGDELGRRWVIEFGDWMEVQIDSTSNEPVEYQIVAFVKRECQERGIMPSDFALDSTGIGRGLKSIFDQEWGEVMGIEFGGSPSELIVDDEGNTAKDVFDRRSSELNIMVKNFAKAHGIRGLSREAGDEFCHRMMSLGGTGKWIVEKKKDMKKRIGKSPDNSDAAACGVALCMQSGAVPGSNTAPGSRSIAQHDARASDDYYSDDNYNQTQQWEEESMMMGL